jgi:uncharacterized repeat protein (TIGR03803 family)
MSELNWALKACGVFLLWAVAAVALSAQTFTTLLSFDNADGANPMATLVQATNGNLYGTTAFGGYISSGGTVFKVTPNGTLTTLDKFCPQRNCPDGEYVLAGLIQATDGDFYGGTNAGGAYGFGTVFKITPSGALTTLHSFDGTDGESPEAAMIQATDGNFYGTTSYGGDGPTCSLGCGTVFKITPSGTLTTLHSFDATDGEYPYGGLVQGSDGNFYGTTSQGGTDSSCNEGLGCGTVFKITPTGVLVTLHSFDFSDGFYPQSALVQGANGEFYGTTSSGGANGYDGTVFKITPRGMLTTLHSFCSESACADGEAPSGLVLATDGDFYGATEYGGTDNYGTVFKITPTGVLATLQDFDGLTGGGNPVAGLLQDTDGTFYGTTEFSGAYGYGTIFTLSVGLGSFVETQPTSGPIGGTVKILGSDLTGATSVTFNGTAAVFAVDSHSLITATVPAGATTGKVQVTVPSGTLSSNVPFTVKP